MSPPAPMGQSGSHAVVYRVVAESGLQRAWRIWTTHRADLSDHYRALTDYLTRLPRQPALVHFTYVSRGIRAADGHWYPALSMEWVDGSDLFTWTRQRCLAGEAARLAEAARKWRLLVDQLARVQIVHGDLSHGNILVTANDHFKLVDYDCLAVPSLFGQTNPEIGVEPYQHPGRDGLTRYSPALSRYASLLIYVALRTLAVRPELWGQHVDRLAYDRLLFRPQDLQEPQASPLLRDLHELPDPTVGRLADQLVAAFRGDLDSVPALSDLALTEG
ncbi:MAG: phosphotransferase [Pirellulales bacterium]